MLTPPNENVVRRLEVFRDTPAEAVRELIAISELVPLAPDQVIYRQGEAIRRDALLLVSGRLRVHLEAGGARRPLADVWPGEFVGEAGLFTRATERTATVTSSAPGWGLRVTRGLLVDNVDQPAIVALEQHLIHTLAKRIHVTNQTLQRALAEKATREGAPPLPDDIHPIDTPARPPRPRPVPTSELTLAQRLSRWWNGDE